MPAIYNEVPVVGAGLAEMSGKDLPADLRIIPSRDRQYHDNEPKPCPCKCIYKLSAPSRHRSLTMWGAHRR